ncbi:MAG: hypothetical protein HKO10_04585 [Acidimicrobiia bacterium]|nr:hypothetical protein [Acidimicrobiia bacterium]
MEDDPISEGPLPPVADEENTIQPESDMLRKVVVGTAGAAVTAAGVVMLVTPGPGVLVTLGGLSILSSEFPAAKRVLSGLRKRVVRGGDQD